MFVVFNEEDYNFMDSIISKIEFDKNLRDFLITVDYYQGKKKSKNLIIRLKNVKDFVFHKKNIEKDNDIFTPITISHISKKVIKNYVQINIESILSFLPNHENDEPLIICNCENVFIEE